MKTPIERVLAKFPDAVKSGKGWLARCPAHDDRRPSLSISEGENGGVVLHCHAGCEKSAVVEANGMTLRDLMPDSPKPSNRNRPIIAVYGYRDEAANLLFQVVRYEPKDFRQRRPKSDGGWNWSVKGCRIVPYRLPELLEQPGKIVFVCEGEKDCENLARHGFVSTCNAGGAGKWKSEHAAFLCNRDAVIFPDNDELGFKHAEQVAASLVGIAKSIKVVELPDLPTKGDISDWLEAGGTSQALQQLIDIAPEWKPRLLPSESTAHDGLYKLRKESGRTDMANAIRFIDRFPDRLLFVPQWDRWLYWDGRRWADDYGVGAMQLAKEYAESLWSDLGILAPLISRDEFGKLRTFIKQSNQRFRINNFLLMAQSDTRIVCPLDSLNTNPMLLNVANGTIDLTTGELRAHNPANRITQLAPVEYDPAATCPKWLETLELIFAGDAEVIRYVQQLLGYSISGDAGEHLLPIAHGSGCNGKSTIWNSITRLLGDYGTLANDSLLLGDSRGHPTEKADLYQKRFVAISEPERSASLRESRVKELTGDAIVKARRMNEDFWTFNRTHKFWLSTNHLPRIGGVDDGIWRRVKLIPFAVDLRKKVDLILGFDLLLVTEEGPGILAWLVRGFLDWKQNGLIEPECVRVATQSYRDDSDALRDFIDECCVIESGAVATAVELYTAYEQAGGKWSKTTFGKAMGERYEKCKSKAGANRDRVVYKGIRIRTESDVQTTPSVAAIKSENSDLGLIGNSLAGSYLGFGKSNTETKATGPNRSLTCPDCLNEMIASPAEPGWENWDCPNCAKVIPSRLMEAQ